jgi:hypothetical protein
MPFSIRLQEGEDVGRAPVGDLVNDGAAEAVLLEKTVGTRRGIEVHIERQEPADRRQHAFLVFRPAGADEKALAALAAEELEIEGQQFEGNRARHFVGLSRPWSDQARTNRT